MDEVFLNYLVEKKEFPISNIGLLRIFTTFPYIYENNIYPPEYKANFLFNPYFNNIEKIVSYIAEKKNIDQLQAKIYYQKFISENFFSSNKVTIDIPGIGYFCKNEKKNWEFFLNLNKIFNQNPIELKNKEAIKLANAKDNLLWYKSAGILILLALILLAYKLIFDWYKH